MQELVASPLHLSQWGGVASCLYASEIDKFASITYTLNHNLTPFGDITKQETKDKIPKNFDILCGGFPCQAFSIAGYQKGFDDARGTLFFEILSIAKKHKPKVLFLENVKNLKNHDNGNTFKVIKNSLESIGYYVYSDVLNSATHANIPQNRERIFIVAFNKNKVKNYEKFTFPKPIKLTKKIKEIILKEKQDDYFYYTPEKNKFYAELNDAIKNQDTLYQWRRHYVRENKSNLCPTLTANMGTGGHNVPLLRDKFGIRKLTPIECFKFQGFENIILPDIAISKLYMQAGNSVTIPLIKRIAEQIIKVLDD